MQVRIIIREGEIKQEKQVLVKSISGFGDLSYVRPKIVAKADKIDEKLYVDKGK